MPFFITDVRRKVCALRRALQGGPGVIAVEPELASASEQVHFDRCEAISLQNDEEAGAN